MVATVVGGLLRLVVGYFIGVSVVCDWLYPTSNLRGIYGVFLAGPIGLLIAALGGWQMYKPERA